MRKTHKSAVVIIPPEAVWPPIQLIRLRHDRQINRWMPHITLLYPFRPRSEFDEVAVQFWNVCSSELPFRITLARFRSFEHSEDSHTIWLNPEPAAPLVRLQEALWRVVPDCDDVMLHEGGFTPHLSVGQARGRDETASLLEELQAAWRPVSFTVDEVSLIWRRNPPDDRFRVDRTIPLGGHVPEGGRSGMPC